MARLAGSGKHYIIETDVRMLDSKTKEVARQGTIKEKYISVTSVIDAIEKPALRDWFYKQGVEGISTILQKYGDKTPHDKESLLSLAKTEKVGPYYQRNKAASRGTDIHETFERLLKGEDIDVTDDNTGLVSWWSARFLTPEHILASEVPLISTSLKVAGTVDVIYRDPVTEVVVCCDLKTGRTIQPTMFVQGEAYRMMAAETPWYTNDLPTAVSVLHVRPPDELADGWQEWRNPEITERSFLAALEMYRALPDHYWNPEEM